MAGDTKIEWCDASLNFWIGCDRIGPGCDHCYAAVSSAARALGVEWSPKAPRHRTAKSTWRQAYRWNRKAEAEGRQWIVFANSLSDMFDNKVSPKWREEAWRVIRDTPHLIWIVVTKRIGNAARMLPPDWGEGYPNVCLMATACTKAEVNRDSMTLWKTPARWRGLSMEPLLFDLAAFDDVRWNNGWALVLDAMDWIIVGGESGPESRDCCVNTVARIIADCAAAGTACFAKQLGARPRIHGCQIALRHPKGGDPAEWPEGMRVRQFPRGFGRAPVPRIASAQAQCA